MSDGTQLSANEPSEEPTSSPSLHRLLYCGAQIHTDTHMNTHNEEKYFKCVYLYKK